MNTEKTKENVERPNKSQLKRDMQALYEQAAYISELKDNKLQKLKLHPAVLDAIEELKRIKSTNARKRHIQYITRLLSEQNNLEEIQNILFEYQNPHILQQQIDRRIDILCEKLLTGNQNTIDDLVAQPQLIDRQNFLQILRNAQKEQQKIEIDEQEKNVKGINNSSSITNNDKNLLKAPDGKQTKKLKKLWRDLIKAGL